METGKKLLCPSYRCAPGVKLIGITDSDGKIHFVSKPVTIDHEFVRTALLGRPPEVRFRFANPCAQKSCQNWADDHCGIAALVVDTAKAPLGELPNCGIRESCRWNMEWGLRICTSCPEVIHG